MAKLGPPNSTLLSGLLQGGSGPVYKFSQLISTMLYNLFLNLFHIYNKYEAGPLLLGPFESLVWHLFTKKHGLLRFPSIPTSKAVEQEGSRFLQWKLEHGNKEAT